MIDLGAVRAAAEAARAAVEEVDLHDEDGLFGKLRMPPRWDFDKVLAAYGLSYDEADRHTAIGDARMAKRLFDAVMSANPPHQDEVS